MVPQPNAPPLLRRVFSEVFLGFLAIISAVLTLIPVLFKVAPQADRILETGQWTIVFAFAAEYAVCFAAAHSKAKFALNPWRLVDAATILIPLATLIPGVSDFLRSTPVLRLLRLARVMALGARASGVITREERATTGLREQAVVQIRKLPGAAGGTPSLVSWEDFVRWARNPGDEWFSVANVGHHNLSKLAEATGIPRDFIAARLLGISYPDVEARDDYFSLFAWLPERTPAGQVDRNGVLLLVGKSGVLTFCRRSTAAADAIAGPVDAALAPLPFPVRVVCRFLKTIIDANETLVGHLESDLRELEELPVRESRPQFFERTFRLKKELSSTQADLWRFRGMLREMVDSRTKLPGGVSGDLPYLRELLDAADYLYETVSNIREGVLSLIELHLNVVSFEMNRVMRVLAVVSVLGLIPAVVGGLFGMNLADNPWPLTLPQVAFMVCAAMVICFYFFVVKGWLR
jgi:Mg2+ and Co2+ transporter CorA